MKQKLMALVLQRAIAIGSVLEWFGQSYKNLEKCRQVKKVYIKA